MPPGDVGKTSVIETPVTSEDDVLMILIESVDGVPAVVNVDGEKDLVTDNGETIEANLASEE
jgi:hypothetical protein